MNSHTFIKSLFDAKDQFDMKIAIGCGELNFLKGKPMKISTDRVLLILKEIGVKCFDSMLASEHHSFVR